MPLANFEFNSFFFFLKKMFVLFWVVLVVRRWKGGGGSNGRLIFGFVEYFIRRFFSTLRALCKRSNVFFFNFSQMLG